MSSQPATDRSAASQRVSGPPRATSSTSTWQPSALDVSSPTYRGPRAGSTRSGSTLSPKRAGVLLAWTGGIVGLVIFGFFLGRPASLPPAFLPAPVAVVESLQGPVDLYAAAASTDRLQATVGTSLAAGVVLETKSAATSADLDGRLALRLADGTSARLDVGSRVELVSESVVELQHGAIYLDAAQSQGVEVRTPFGTVRDIGTQFEVRLLLENAGEGALRVRVREGLIVFNHGTQAYGAGAGTELTLTTEGRVEKGDIPIFGPHWDWVLKTAALPDFAGQSLETFLQWFTREGGYEMQIHDPETAAQVSKTILHGQLAGLTPEAALEIVLQGSGLTYALEDGQLTVADHPPVDGP